MALLTLKNGSNTAGQTKYTLSVTDHVFYTITLSLWPLLYSVADAYSELDKFI